MSVETLWKNQNPLNPKPTLNPLAGWRLAAREGDLHRHPPPADGGIFEPKTLKAELSFP